MSLRCSVSDVEDMWMAMNAEHFGGFDDIILYKKDFNKGNSSKMYMIQLKHQDKTKNIIRDQFLAEKGNYSMKKYEESLIAGLNKNKLLDANGNEIIPVIFTNNGINPYDFLKDEQNLKSSFLNTNNGNVFKFDYGKLGYKLQSTKSSKYFGDLLLFTNQIDVLEVNNAIEIALGSLLNNLYITPEILNRIIEKYLIFISDWKSGLLGGYYKLSKIHVMKKVFELVLESYMSNFYRRERSLICTNNGYKFRPKLWNEIIENFNLIIMDSQGDIFHFLLENVVYTSRKYQEGTEHYNSEQEYRRIMLRNVSISERRTLGNDYECLWKSNRIHLVLEAQTQDDFNKIGEIIDVFHNQQKLYKIIILKSKNIEENKLIKNHFRNLNILRSLNDLTNEEHIKIILSSEIKFQGRSNFTLNKLINTDIKRYLQVITINDILNILSNAFNIGNTLNALPDFFIERFVSRIVLDLKFLEERSTTENFIISCKNPKKFKSILDKNFNNDNKNPTHHLNLHDTPNGPILEWIKTEGDTARSIRTYRRNPEINYLSYLKINEIENIYLNHFKLITAGPGMGKSVLLDYLALQAPIHMWILRINLSNYINYYQTKDFKNSTCIDYLEYFNKQILRNYGSDSILNEAIFEECLINKNVLLLLDGFDEIAFRYKTEVTKMILSWKKEKFPIWLTTRPLMKEYVEDMFDTPSIYLTLFNNQQQKEFLMKFYYKLNLLVEDGKEDLIEKFVIRLLKLVERNLNDPCYNQFMGVPLHIKLLAEMFKERFSNFINTQNLNLRESSLNLINLYEFFIKEKINIFNEKYKKYFTEDVCNNYEAYQQYLSLNILFPNNNLDALPSFHNIKTRIINFEKFLKNESVFIPEDELNLTLIHKTYAEYLGAKYLSENLTEKSLIKELFNSDYQNLRNFFDKILARHCDFHNVIINSNFDLKKINKFTSRTNINFLDKAGRTTMHLIATRGTYHKIPLHPEDLKYLKTAKKMDIKDFPDIILKNVHDKDTIFNYTPLEYANQSKCLDVMDIICSRAENQLFDIPEDPTIINSYLYYCSLYGYTSLCETIFKNLQNKPTLLKDSMGMHLYPIHIAARKRRTDIIELFLKHTNKFDPNKKNNDGTTPLHIACENGFEDILILLLSSKSIFIDTTDNLNFTPLHKATLNGHVEIVTLLLSYLNKIPSPRNTTYENFHREIYNKKSSYVNMTDKDKNTALHFAAINGFTPIASLLLDSGADANVINSSGYSPLHLASYKGHTSTVFVLLSSGKSNINIPTRSFDTYLMDSSSTPLHEATRGGHINTVSLLLSNGANFNLKNQRGFTPLHEASKCGHKKIVSILLNHPIDINSRSSSESTSLHEAAKNGHSSIVSILIHSNADTNQEDNDGCIPLHKASSKGHSEVVLKLLPVSNVNARNKIGATPLYLASKYGHRDIVSLLLSRSAEVNIPSNSGSTALHKAVQGGYKDIVSLLLSNSAKINLGDSQGRTPLFLACSSGHASIVSLLLAKNANTEKTNKYGVTALHEAVYSGDANLVRELLVYKARVNVKDSTGKTALHHAVAGNNLTVIKELIKYGAEVNVKDLDGNSPLDLTRKLNYSEAVQWLEEYKDCVCATVKSI